MRHALLASFLLLAGCIRQPPPPQVPEEIVIPTMQVTASAPVVECPTPPKRLPLLGAGDVVIGDSCLIFVPNGQAQTITVIRSHAGGVDIRHIDLDDAEALDMLHKFEDFLRLHGAISTAQLVCSIE